MNEWMNENYGALAGRGSNIKELVYIIMQKEKI